MIESGSQPVPPSQQIWQGRGLSGHLQSAYAAGVRHHRPDGVQQGAAAAVRAAIEEMHWMPDRQLLSEDVIPGALPGGPELSAHRVLCLGTHRGAGAFGPATGAALRYRMLVESVSVEDQIAEIWSISDTGALLRQIGRTPEAWARDALTHAAALAAAQDQELVPERPAPEPPAIAYDGQGNDSPWGMRLADLLARLMEVEFSAVASDYDPACAVHYPGGRDGAGHAAADRFWLPLRAAFPSAVFTIHHLIGCEAPLMPPRAAVRWSMEGRHEGHGAFGAPSGAFVRILGMTQAEFGPAGLRREWTLYDEAEIWRQILSAAG